MTSAGRPGEKAAAYPAGLLPPPGGVPVFKHEAYVTEAEQHRGGYPKVEVVASRRFARGTGND